MDCQETEKIGRAMSILESLNNNLLKYSSKTTPNRFWKMLFTHLKIEKVIKFIDELVI